MVEKIRYGVLFGIVTAQDFIRDFKNDEKGVSGVVVTVLLLLLAIILIAIFWDGINALVTNLWNQIRGDVEGFQGVGD